MVDEGRLAHKGPGDGDFFRLFGLPAGVGQAEREFLVGDGSEDSGKFLAPRPGIKRCRKHDFQFASYVISQLVDFEEGALEPRRGNFERPVGGEGVFHVEGETREPRQFRALIDGDALREQIVVGGLFGRGGFGAGKDVDVNPGDGAGGAAQFNIPTDSEAKIFSNGLMGAKAIEITYGTADTYLQKGDTLRSSRDRDLMDMAGSELDFFKQKVSQLTTDLSRTLENLNGLMETNADNIAGTLGNLNSVTGDMAEILSAEKNSLKSALDNLSKFSDMLGENAGRVDSIIGDVDRFTSQLTEEQFARKLSQAVEHLDGLVACIAQGEGTIGKLISDPELYDSLEKASDNLAALLADVKQYPGRYVHLSLFGRNPEKMKERADRKAAKAAAKAERDSLKRLQ